MWISSRFGSVGVYFKSGGFKISALEVEREILSHAGKFYAFSFPLNQIGVEDVAVMGIPDDVRGEMMWGERVAALLVTNHEHFSTKELRMWLKRRISPHMIPTLYKIVKELPRNTLGKMDKKQMRLLFAD